MTGEKDKDGNIIVDPKDPGADPGNSDPGKGAEGNEPSGDGGDKGALSKEDIQGIVKESIENAVKDVITPELDRRISGATKTIYSKVELKKQDPDNKNQPDAGVKAEADRLANRREMVGVYAESVVKEELGKLEPEIQAVVDKLLPIEIAGVQFEEGVTNKDHSQVVATSIVKIVKDMQGKVESAKVEALKKAGQIIDVGTGGGKTKPEDEFEAGKKLAEQRHPKKK